MNIQLKTTDIFIGRYWYGFGSDFRFNNGNPYWSYYFGFINVRRFNRYISY